MPNLQSQSRRPDAAAGLAWALTLVAVIDLLFGAVFGVDLALEGVGPAAHASALTLICFALLGASLLLALRDAKGAAAALLLGVALLAAANLALILGDDRRGLNLLVTEWSPGADFRIEERMSPATSTLALLLAGALTLLLANRVDAARHAATVGLVCAMGLVVSAPLSLVYFSDNEAFSGTSLETAALAAAGFAAAAAAAGRGGWPEILTAQTPASQAARRVAPLFLLLPVMLVLLSRAADANDWAYGDMLVGVIAAGVATASLAILFRGARELNAALDERTRDVAWRELLLRELNHRTKNNLQQMVAVIALQIDRAEDAATREALESLTNRIKAIRLADNLLSQSVEEAADGRVDASILIRDLCHALADGFDLAARGVELEVRATSAPVSGALATPLALMVGELVSNAAKHAHPDGRGGRILVELTRPGQTMELAVSDDGVGKRGPSEGGLGSLIVQGLSDQIGGGCVWSEAPDGGVRAVVAIPCDAFEEKRRNS